MLHLGEVGQFIETVLNLIRRTNLRVEPTLVLVLTILLVFCGFALWLVHRLLENVLRSLTALGLRNQVSNDLRGANSPGVWKAKSFGRTSKLHASCKRTRASAPGVPRRGNRA